MKRIIGLSIVALSLVGCNAPILSTGPDVRSRIELLNGKNLNGWSYYLADRNAELEDVWTVDSDGVLICRGNPWGYLRTKRDYANYKLTLEWRWPAGSPRSANSGLFLHTTTPQGYKIWPKAVEIQLQYGNAGDFVLFATDLVVPNMQQRRVAPILIKNLTDRSEKPMGQWNRMTVLAQGNTFRVYVNGDLVNEATNCTESLGAICLQSEGAEIHFRKLQLEPLPGM